MRTFFFNRVHTCPLSWNIAYQMHWRRILGYEGFIYTLTNFDSSLVNYIFIIRRFFFFFFVFDEKFYEIPLLFEARWRKTSIYSLDKETKGKLDYERTPSFYRLPVCRPLYLVQWPPINSPPPPLCHDKNHVQISIYTATAELLSLPKIKQERELQNNSARKSRKYEQFNASENSCFQ